MNISEGKNKMKAYEASLLKEAMEVNGFNQSSAAQWMGLSRGAFRYKLEEYYGSAYFGNRKQNKGF